MNIKDYWVNLPNIAKGASVWLVTLLAGTVIAISQHSCGKKHEAAAEVHAIAADTHAKELADLKQQLAGKDSEIASVKETASTFKKKYEAAKAKIPIAPLPPTTEPALAASLKELGLGNDLEVHIAATSIVSFTDAQLIFTMGQETKRAKALDEAVITCAQALTASEATVKAQGEGLALSSQALVKSQAEAVERAAQAQEIGKALKIEKAKGWQKYVWGAAGVVATVLIKK